MFLNGFARTGKTAQNKIGETTCPPSSGGATKTNKFHYFQKYIASCRNDLKQTWSVTNGIIGKKFSISPNCIKNDGKLLTASFEIAESFNDHFSSIANKLRAKLSSPPSPTNLKSKSNSSEISSFFHAKNRL